MSGIDLARQVLLGLQPLDAVSGRPVPGGRLRCQGSGGPVVHAAHTRTGLIAIHDLKLPGDPGRNAAWRAHARGGDVPEPLELTLSLEATDGRYLPRLLTVNLPRAADPAADDALARPVPVWCFAPASRSPLPGSALVLVVIRRGDGRPFAGASCELLRDGAVRARALSDLRGEALLELPGLRAREPDAGNGFVVPESTLDLRITADRRGPWPVDPSALDSLPPAHLHQTTGPVTVAVDRLTRPAPVIVPDPA